MKIKFQMLLGGVGVLLLLTAWELALYFGVSPRLLPTPISVLKEMIVLTETGTLGLDIQATGTRWLLGFTVGACSGAAMGFIIACSTTLKALLSLVMDFFRSIPITASFPLFLLFFGIGDQSKIAMAAFSVFMPVLVAVASVENTIPNVRRSALKVYGADRLFVSFSVLPYQAVSVLNSVLKTTLSFSLMVTIVSEMFIGSGMGIGQRLFESYQNNRAPALYCYLIISGAMGILVNLALNVLSLSTSKAIHNR